MHKLLPYPWQHPTYTKTEFDNAADRITFCKERASEAKEELLHWVARAWESEANTCIDGLIKENENLRGLLNQKLMVRNGKTIKHCGFSNAQKGDIWYMKTVHKGRLKPNIFADETPDYID